MHNRNTDEGLGTTEYIAVVGSSNTDMVVKTAHIPNPGETVMGGEFMMCPGGKGANQAVTIARLGGKISFVTKLGNDIFGEQSKKAFEEVGVNVEFVSFDEEHPSGVALITVDEEGENCIVVAPGANSFLGIEELNEAENCILGAGIILTQLEIPLESVAHVARLAKSHQKKLILNPAPACSLPKSILDGLYFITPNETEAEILTGIKVTDEDSWFAVAEHLKSNGVQNVIITLGDKGAFVSSDEFTGLVEAEKVKVVDTTGAGDIFNGALALGLSQGKGVETSVRFATLVSGLSVSRAGAQASIPSLSELELLA